MGPRTYFRKPIHYVKKKSIFVLRGESNQLPWTDMGGSGKTDLMVAAERGDADEVRNILKYDDYDLRDICNEKGRNALSYAVLSGDLETFKAVEEACEYEDIEAQDDDGLTALMIAAATSANEILGHHMKNPWAKVYEKDRDYCDALFHAIMNDNVEGAKMLLAHKSVSSYDKRKLNDNSRLIEAILRSQVEIVELLLEDEDIQINEGNEHIDTPLHFCCRLDERQIAKMLLDRPEIMADKKNKFGYTPLMTAARAGNEAVVSLLIKSGKELALDDIAYGIYEEEEFPHKNALQIAKELGHSGIVRQIAFLGQVDDLADEDEEPDKSSLSTPRRTSVVAWDAEPKDPQPEKESSRPPSAPSSSSSACQIL